MKKILLVFGTRPEAIKMAPLIKAFKLNTEDFETKICVTAQHRQMLDQVLGFFSITPDYDLNLMKPNQTLSDIWIDILSGMKSVFEDYHPDWVFIHGDTATSAAVALSSFFAGSKVAHVEAGLRTWNKLAPFPEEINRQIISRIADIHFAPTINSKQNLIAENINPEHIAVTGNTVIDALYESVEIVNNINYENEEIANLNKKIDFSKRLILVTGHRRENFGDGFIRIYEALREIAYNNPDVQIIYPVHLNPNVQIPANIILSEMGNIHLIPPLAYPSFVWLMNKSSLIITDSGGVQEEAPSLGKPVLVMRDVTERPEAVKAGTVILVGTDKDKIISETTSLLNDVDRYYSMSKLHNPYGDGNACNRIINHFKRF